jgi:hypothetical protein
MPETISENNLRGRKIENYKFGSDNIISQNIESRDYRESGREVKKLAIKDKKDVV